MLEAQSAHSETTGTTAGTERRLTVMSGPDPHEPHVCGCSAEARAIRAELATYLLALSAAQGALSAWRADLDALREDLAAIDPNSLDLDLDPLDHG